MMNKEELNRIYGKAYFDGKNAGNPTEVNKNCKKVVNTFDFLKKFGIEPIYADTDCICLKYTDIDRISERYEENLKEIAKCHEYIDDTGGFDEHIADISKQCFRKEIDSLLLKENNDSTKLLLAIFLAGTEKLLSVR